MREMGILEEHETLARIAQKIKGLQCSLRIAHRCYEACRSLISAEFEMAEALKTLYLKNIMTDRELSRMLRELLCRQEKFIKREQVDGQRYYEEERRYRMESRELIQLHKDIYLRKLDWRDYEKVFDGEGKEERVEDTDTIVVERGKGKLAEGEFKTNHKGEEGLL